MLNTTFPRTQLQQQPLIYEGLNSNIHFELQLKINDFRSVELLWRLDARVYTIDVNYWCQPIANFSNLQGQVFNITDVMKN